MPSGQNTSPWRKSYGLVERSAGALLGLETSRVGFGGGTRYCLTMPFAGGGAGAFHLLACAILGTGGGAGGNAAAGAGGGAGATATGSCEGGRERLV